MQWYAILIIKCTRPNQKLSLILMYTQRKQILTMVPFLIKKVKILHSAYMYLQCYSIFIIKWTWPSQKHSLILMYTQWKQIFTMVLFPEPGVPLIVMIVIEFSYTLTCLIYWTYLSPIVSPKRKKHGTYLTGCTVSLTLLRSC